MEQLCFFFYLGSENFDDIRVSDVKKNWVPFSDVLVIEILLGSLAIEMRNCNKVSIASVMIMETVECIYTMCYITVLIAI